MCVRYKSSAIAPPSIGMRSAWFGCRENFQHTDTAPSMTFLTLQRVHTTIAQTVVVSRVVQQRRGEKNWVRSINTHSAHNLDPRETTIHMHDRLGDAALNARHNMPFTLKAIHGIFMDKQLSLLYSPYCNNLCPICLSLYSGKGCMETSGGLAHQVPVPLEPIFSPGLGNSKNSPEELGIGTLTAI